MKKALLSAGIVAVAFVACKKKNDDNTQVAPTSSIVGKWNGVNEINTRYTNNVRSLDTTSTVGTITEFTADGKVYNDGDTAIYKLDGNKLYIGENNNTDTFQILTLNDHALSLYESQVDYGSSGGAHTFETWANYTR